MIVADANVWMHLVVSGPKTEAARQVHARDPRWLAPSLLVAEALNVLATWNRKGYLTDHQSYQAWGQIAPIVREGLCDPEPQDVLRLALEHRLSAYDATYIALARQRGLWLVTEDLALLRCFPGHAVSMPDFLAAHH